MSRRIAVFACLLAATFAAGCGGHDTSGPGLGQVTRDDAPATSVPAEDGEASLGLPFIATKNTTRVPGPDPATNAAGVARAVFPSTGPASRPAAVALIDGRDWRTAVAGAVLASTPIHAAVLLSDGPALPAVSAQALRALAPRGAKAAGGAQVVRVGDAATPAGVKTTQVTGRDPFALARALDAFQAAARGTPSTRVVIASADDPGFAMPAAAWAAKAGDPVLFVRRDEVPAETRAAIRAHGKPRIYVLGPPAAISDKTVAALKRLGAVRRIAGADPAANSVAFARYVDQRFGWGVMDPGHGIVFARADRPLDAAAAAPLSVSGTYGPLLVNGSADELDPALTRYLLDIQPAYSRDPVRGVYNHGWIVGDERAISVDTQARIDSLLEIRRFGTTSKQNASR
jgi:ell wall binding domain 2 (CWB2)